MPTNNRTPQSPKDSSQRPAMPQPDATREDQRDMQPTDTGDEDIENSGGVEIGDPVPEDNRTIRARGETGEDEDLPDDGGDIERSTTSRH